jgi:hypothetical protein
MKNLGDQHERKRWRSGKVEKIEGWKVGEEFKV